MRVELRVKVKEVTVKVNKVAKQLSCLYSVGNLQERVTISIVSGTRAGQCDPVSFYCL